MSHTTNNAPYTSRQFLRKHSDGSFTRGFRDWEEMPDKDSWEFVCQFLPDYERRDDVMTSDDLACVIDKEKTLQWLYETYSEWDGLSIEELKKVRAQWDYELMHEAEGYLTASTQAGDILVREFPVTIVSANPKHKGNIVLQPANSYYRSRKHPDGYTFLPEEFQNVQSRIIDGQFQVRHPGEEYPPKQWYIANPDDFQ